jgi:hypothetical protein
MLDLERGAVVRVELIDVLGRRLRLLHDGYMTAGTQSLQVASTGLPAGTYFVRAVGDGASVTTAVTIYP